MYLQILSSLNVKNDQQILDVGCGDGSTVKELRQQGVQAFGCDVEFKDGPYIADLISNKLVKKIGATTTTRNDITKTSHDYTWPWDDNKFDFVCSRAVVEHVNNIDQFLNENYRVLKPGGIAMHYFPSRYSLIEPHIGIMFGGVFQNLTYYKIMCAIGLCKARYKNNGQLAYSYMKQSCFYNTDSDLKTKCEAADLKVISFDSKLVLKYYKNGKFAHFCFIPFFCWIFYKLRSRTILLKRDK